MDCFGTAVSMSLQYGVPLEVYVNKFSHARFEPQGHTKNPDIRIATSIVDYIFRWLGLTFMSNREMPAGGDGAKLDGPQGAAGDADAETMPAAKMAGGPTAGQGSASSTNGNGSSPRSTNGHTNGNGTANGSARRPATSPAAKRPQEEPRGETATATSGRNEQFASFQADAPVCDNCGSLTVRTGNCYLCHVCGSSMGCS
jgi:ribonucleoside-diphosphate reductase alpha chain